MRRLRSTGICIVILFTASLYMTASASAQPRWRYCYFVGPLKGTFVGPLCLVTGLPEAWEYKPPAAPVPVTSHGTFKLEDTGSGLQIECSVTSSATIGSSESASVDNTTEIAASECKTLKGTCASPATEAIHLPWKSVLEEPVAGEIRDKFSSAEKEPGWKVSCAKTTADTCEGVTTTKMTNDEAEGIVEAAFDSKSAHENCTSGGSGSGVVEGTWTIEHHVACTEKEAIGVE